MLLHDWSDELGLLPQTHQKQSDGLLRVACIALSPERYPTDKALQSLLLLVINATGFLCFPRYFSVNFNDFYFVMVHPVLHWRPPNIISTYATAVMYFNVMYHVLNELMQDEKLGICIHFTLFST